MTTHEQAVQIVAEVERIVLANYCETPMEFEAVMSEAVDAVERIIVRQRCVERATHGSKLSFANP